jgi:hypothetical protein
VPSCKGENKVDQTSDIRSASFRKFYKFSTTVVIGKFGKKSRESLEAAGMRPGRSKDYEELVDLE